MLQNYKTLILELPRECARARARPPLPEKKGDRRRLRVIVTLFTRSASNCLSLRENGGLCTPLAPWFRRGDGRLRRARGATQRETLDERAMAHPRSPVRRGRGRVENGPAGRCRNSMGRKRGENEMTRADDAGGRETPMTAGEDGKGEARRQARPRVGMERSWVQRFLRDVGG